MATTRIERPKAEPGVWPGSAVTIPSETETGGIEGFGLLLHDSDDFVELGHEAVAGLGVGEIVGIINVDGDLFAVRAFQRHLLLGTID